MKSFPELQKILISLSSSLPGIPDEENHIENPLK